MAHRQSAVGYVQGSARNPRTTIIHSSFSTRHRRTSLLTGAFLLTGLLTPASAAAAEAKTITVAVDGRISTVVTHGSTVAETLAEHAIAVDAQDAVTPALETPVTEGSAVAVVFSKTVKLKVGSQKAAKLTMPAVTVQDALAQADVAVDEDDRVTPRLQTPLEASSRIVVERVKYKTLIKRYALQYKTVTKPAPRMYKGERKTVKQGKMGKARLTYERKIVNGRIAYTKRIDRKLVLKPVTAVVLVGTKARPSGGLTGVWKALAQCESGGNPSIVSSNGLYHGLFQFSVGTWQGVGGSGLPSQASVAEQLKRAKILQARSGWGQWPHCSSALGLR